jgi:hypothetical protein
MTSSRLQVALPAVLTFVFGVAFGIVAGRMLFTRPAQAPGMQAQAMPMGAGPQAEAQQAEPTPAEVEAESRRMLDLHAQQLAKAPDDVGLNRMVANYHVDLGESDEALALYGRARELAEKAGDAAQVTDIMIDEGIALVEKGDIAGGLKRMEDAAARDPKDIRGRLTRTVVYLQRVMPSPPPGFDRRQALASAEGLIAEVLAIDPQNEYALQFRSTIESVRGMMRQGAAEGAAPSEPAPSPAPPTASRP